MSGAAKVNFKTTNLTQTVASPFQGISFVSGQSIRGPFADASEVINSWSQFVAKYGGLFSKSDAPLLVKRLLEKGGSVRFNRVGHYADISDPTSLDAVVAEQPTVTKLTFDSPFDTGHEIEMTLNGDLLDGVDYTLDNNNTLDLIAEGIESHPDVLSAVVIENSNGENDTIFITPNMGASITLTAINITGGTTTPVETITTLTSIEDANGNTLFELVPKYPGEDFNNFIITITPGINGVEGYFNINIRHKIEGLINETFNNLFINGNPTAETSTYLDVVIAESQYFNVVYTDLSGTTGQVTPLPMSFQLINGSNGTDPDDNDYIGSSSARNGFFAFDEYDDAYNLAVFDNNSDTVNTAGAAYAANRQDLVYFIHLDNSLRTKQALINKRTSLPIDTKFTYFVGGGIKIADPITKQIKEVAGTGDILAGIAKSDKEYGEWYSFAGPNRGVINGVLGVANNFGAPANYKDLDDLANRQINMIIQRNGSVKLWGNFSGQYANDQERFISIVRLIIFMKKSLRPTLEEFLEEPNDIPTWKRIYYTVKPFLDDLVTKRALYSYDWQGDQFVSTLNDLQINNYTDVTNGKYKVKLILKAIPSLQEIEVDLILSPAGISFETINELI